jgi:ankyrin repeat protein
MKMLAQYSFLAALVLIACPLHASPDKPVGGKPARRDLNKELIESFEPAIKTGNYARLEALLKKGANLNAPDANGVTPFMYALSAPDEKLAAFLLRRGADARVRDKQGRTTLFYAALLQAAPATIRRFLPP